MSALDDLPPLRDVVREHGLDAKRSLGQNFLFDLNLTARIARASGPLEGVTVVEVGPGPGGLTRALLALGARRVVAVERDERCLPALAAIGARYPGRLDVVSGDALETDWEALGLQGPVRVVANLPYNIATVLLTGWLEVEPWPPLFESFTLMFQREVAERIVATVGPEGLWPARRSVRLADQRPDPVRRGAFRLPPPAKVTSSVVHLVPNANPLPCRREDLAAVTQAAFGQRRKMLRQSLKPLGMDPQPILEAAGIDPTARAETVPVEAFVAMANAWRALRG